MAARIGNVLYSIGIIVAALWLVFESYAVINDPRGFDAIALVVVGAIAFISFGIGWACRYILSGR